jgi:hypothetical protein
MNPTIKTSDKIDVKGVFLDSLRMYFAPLIGAFKAIKAEMARMERRHHA